MYYNLLDCLMLLLHPSIASCSRWICWNWTIVWSAGATCISPISDSSSLLSVTMDPLLIPLVRVTTDSFPCFWHTVSNLVAHHGNLLSHVCSDLVSCCGNLLSHYGMHLLADIRRARVLDTILVGEDRHIKTFLKALHYIFWQE
jgi:hypothetical protein